MCPGDCSRCCTACRLVHSGAARRCRFCRAPLAELRELVSSARRRRLERRTVTKRGWRWFDVVLAVVAVLGPLQVERRHPSWFVPALIAAVGLWALVRLVVWFFSRYRLVWASGPPRVDAVVFPARARRGDSERGGVARGLGATVGAHLVLHSFPTTTLFR